MRTISTMGENLNKFPWKEIFAWGSVIQKSQATKWSQGPSLTFKDETAHFRTSPRTLKQRKHCHSLHGTENNTDH